MHPPPDQLRVGVSACILGQQVRYDGGHKLDRFVRDTLGACVDLVAICPEVELGLGVPRETIHLEHAPADATKLRLLAPQSGADHTVAMQRYAARRAAALDAEKICGFIAQRGSPSCGAARVRIYPAGGGRPRSRGRGMFTAELARRLPDLPIEDSARLDNARLRENFITRIFAFARLRTLFAPRWKIQALAAFHRREELLLLAHDRPAQRKLGQLVAAAERSERKELAAEYRSLFLRALSKIATLRKQESVLRHVAGRLDGRLDAGARRELLKTIESYGRGITPLLVPLTLLRHHVRRHELTDLARQSYLAPRSHEREPRDDREDILHKNRPPADV